MNTNEMQPASTTISEIMAENKKDFCEKHQCKKEEMKYGNEKYNYWSCPECIKDAEIAQSKEREAEMELQKKRILFSGIPSKFHSARIEDFCDIDPVKKWIEQPNGFLFIHGSCGCGKTHLACAIKYLFNLVRQYSFLAFSSDFFLNLRNTFNKNSDETELNFINKYAPDEELLRKGYRKEIGIFDDIGAQKISEYVIEAWYTIIDRRYMFEYPTIFTSNLSLKEISICMSDRIASRMASGVVFEMTGKDRRIIKGA